MDKKSNMAFWDSLDDMTEEFVKQYIAAAAEKLEIDDEDIVIEIAKRVQETVLNELENYDIDTNIYFPYVDENY